LVAADASAGAMPVSISTAREAVKNFENQLRVFISPSSFFIIRAFQSPVCKISASQINPNLPDWIPQFTAYFWNLNYYTTSPFDFLIQKYYVFFIFSHFYHKAFTDFTL